MSSYISIEFIVKSWDHIHLFQLTVHPIMQVSPSMVTIMDNVTVHSSISFANISLNVNNIEDLAPRI